MAKKSMLERELKRKKLINKYSKQRDLIKKELKQANSLDLIFELNEYSSYWRQFRNRKRVSKKF